MDIIEVSGDAEQDWDYYVSNHPGSSFLHLYGWGKVIRKTYGHRPLYLAALEGDSIVGVLPMVLVKGAVTGKKLISVPFGSYGGPIADNDTIGRELVDKARELAGKHSTKYLEIRDNPRDNPGDNPRDNPVTDSAEHLNLLQAAKGNFVSSILELKETEGEMWDSLKKNKRKTISKSEKQSIFVEWDDDEDDFYPLYARNMRDLGTPVHSKKFFAGLLREFPGSAKLQVVRLADGSNTIIYSSFYILHGDTMTNCWSSALQEYRDHYPTDRGIWDAIKYGIEKGCRFYDFGRSISGSPNQEFKRRWGAVQEPMTYRYHMLKGKMPDYDLSGASASRFTKLWRRMPLPLAGILGPRLRKHIP
jgi:FemAB-related protein (PEP-CTERM system-associated)